MDVNGTGWADRLMQWLRFGTHLILVNLLFVAGALAGAVVFGLFPAAVAASTVLARLRAGGGGEQLVQDFVAAYRARFLHANAVGGLFWAAGIVWALNLTSLMPMAGGASPAADSPLAAAIPALVSVVGLWTVLAAACAVTACARYRDTVMQTWRYAFVLPLASPVMSLALLASLGAASVLFAEFDVLIPLFGASLPLFVADWLVEHRMAVLARKSAAERSSFA
ncbi:YesL family protein [Arthrobacter sp. ISL-30]|uniref:YesL family protein n=1 Tax=Arthrobacter sp. ISL-30 TaxID=2819109 RepID=UPI001BE791C2|nr:DUF624 domain-containing protein [Arthrobacter sp. ISL-30]MBT2513813.1 DUF624 domain-containing protein [Arthrobacter sp. ISL-30]